MEWLVDRYGYTLKETDAPLRGPREFFAMVSRKGFEPATVIDIGVAHGTQWLYDPFPEAYFVLVEANRDFEPALIQICKRYRGEYHLFAAGAENATGTLYVNRSFPTSSGLAQPCNAYLRTLEKNSSYTDLEEREVSIRPLDSIRSAKLKRPFLIKMDIEGYEAEALKGAVKILPETELIVTELSVQKRFRDELLFASFVTFMDEIGFEFFDIIGLSQRSRDGPLTYMDAVFVNRNSKLRDI